MATFKLSVFGPWMLSIVLAVGLFPTNVTSEIIPCVIEPAQDVLIDIPEELEVGTVLQPFTVEPPGSTISYNCEELNPSPLVCEYIERDGLNLVMKKRFDIDTITLENPDLASRVYNTLPGREGHIVFWFMSTTLLSCVPPGGSGFDKVSRVISQPYINNVNEPPKFPTNFTTHVAELALGDTELVFNTDILAEDGDINLETEDPSRRVFNCTILESDVPFFVSSCENEFDPITSYAENIAKISVSPPPPTLDYETQKYYNVTLQISDLADYWGRVNRVNTTLYISIDDLDDQDPEFNFPSFSASVDENQSSVKLDIKPGDIFAKDLDTLNAEVAYSLSDIDAPLCQNNLNIDETTAEVTVASAFDREEIESCEVDVVAYQRFNVVRFSTAELVITINDINDRCPEFDYPTYDGIVTVEDLYVMTNETMERLLVTATDADMDLDFLGDITFDFNGAEDVFEIITEQILETNSKQIYIKLRDPGLLDTTKTYTIEITVSDTSIPCDSSFYSSLITVRPVDLTPRFDQLAYENTIPEDIPFRYVVATVAAVTWDGSTEGIMYRLTKASNNGLLVFEMNDESGEIAVISRDLDATKVSEYVLFVEAEDRRSQPVRSIASTVTIFVTDTNNKCPQFTRDEYSGEISASDVYAVEVGTLTQLTLVANDNDTEITYTDVSITSGNTDGVFALELAQSYGPQSAQWFIRLADPLLLVDGSVYNLQVTLTDTSYVTCVPQVVDITISAADLSPIFSLNEYTANVEELAVFGTFVVKVEATSYSNQPDNIFYTLKSGNNQGLGYFGIHRVSGDITVIDNNIDAETVKEFTLVVEAEDRSTQPPRTASTTVIISVINLNDRCPEFDEEFYTGTVTPQDKYVIRNEGTLSRLVLTTVDQDKIFNGSIALVDDADGIFGIEQSIMADGSAAEVYIILRDPRLGLDDYSVLVSINDPTKVPANPPCPAAIANVNIIISADLSPVFDAPADGYRTYLPENTPTGVDIITITARSYDGTTLNIVYQLKSASDNGLSLFAMDRTTGVISTISDGTNYEFISEYTLVIEAQDRGTEPFRSSTTTVIISLNNTNDNCPLFDKMSYSGQITLQDLYVTDADTLERLVLVARDNDMDFIGDIIIQQRGDNDGIFVLEEDLSLPGLSRVSIKLVDDDLLGLPSYTLQILASDTTAENGIDCSGTPVEVTVTVASDLAPIFSKPEYTAIIVEGSAKGTFVVTIVATSQSGSLDIVYIKKSVSNDGDSIFIIERTTGIIRLDSVDTDYENVKEYTIVVEAQDRGSAPFRTATTTVTVTITNANDECPSFDSDTYTGTVTPQDKYVIKNDGSLDRLILMTVDPDMEFSGEITVPDSSGGIFGIADKLNTDGSAKEVYITLLDPTKLGLDDYTVLVSITDPDKIPSVPACTDYVADVSIVISADLSPVFDAPSEGYRTYLPENTPTGVDVIRINATSYDGTTVNIVYQLKSASDNGWSLFALDRTTGVISTISDGTDFEFISEYTLVIEAQDRGTEPFRSSTTTVIISLGNTNDNCPLFNKMSYSGQITLQDLYVTDADTLDRLFLVATDADMDFMGAISLLPGPGDGIFVIEEDRSLSGMSRVSIKLLDDDLLSSPEYSLQIQASDSTADPSCTDIIVPVVIQRVADLAPNFTEPEYSGNIEEGSTGVIVTIVATSESDNSDIVYILKSVSNNGGDLFTIGRTSGEITLVSSDTNYESLTQYTLVVEAQDRGVEPFRSSTTTVFVYLNDTDDNFPQFSEPSYSGRITLQDLFVVTGSGGTERLVIKVLDADTEFNGDISIAPGPGDGIFKEVTALVDDGRAMEVYIQLLDPQLLTESQYILTISVTIGSFTDVRLVTIEVVTNLAPIFDQTEYSGAVEEGTSSSGVVIVKVTATSQNTGTADILYNFKSGSNGGLLIFDIDQKSGDVTLISDDTDYEKFTEYTLVVEAQDRGTEPPRSATTVVIITITDKNDNCPYFDELQYFGSVTSGDLYVVEQGKVESLRLKASDNDTAFSGSAQIVSNPPDSNLFGLESNIFGDEVRITLVNSNGIQDGETYELTVTMNDGGCNPASETSVTINVVDLSPTFSPKDYQTFVDEDEDIGHVIVQVNALNKDGGSEGIVYSISWASGDGENKFDIDSDTGDIFLSSRGVIDADDIAEYTLSVIALDVRLEPPRSDSATVNIKVNDINDVCPEFDVSTYTGSMSLEDSFVLVEDGTERLRIVAADGDVGGFNGDFNIDPASDEGFELVATQTTGEQFIQVADLSLIELGVYTLVITVTDNTIAGLTCDTEVTVVTITVSDEFNPKFDNDTYVGHVPERAGIGFVVIQVTARNKDGDSAGIIYRIISGNNNWQDYFKIDPATGDITVISVNIDAEVTLEFTLFVEAVDTTLEPERSGKSTVTIVIGDINDQCPRFDILTYEGSMNVGDNTVLEADGINRLAIIASDDDISGFTDTMTAEIESSSDGGFGIVSVNPGQWNLRVIDSLLVGIGTYTVEVSVTDSGTVGVTCSKITTTITVTVTDDLNPKFEFDPYQGNVKEGSSLNLVVVQVSAEKKDGTTDGIIYRIISGSNIGLGYFDINPQTGDVFVSAEIDAEVVTEISLFVEAVDTQLDPQKTGSTTVTIQIGDENDKCPEFAMSTYFGSMNIGDSMVSGIDGSDRLALVATDEDVSGFEGYSYIASDSSDGAFGLVDTSATGQWNIRVVNSSLISVGTYNVQVDVTDDAAVITCSPKLTSIEISVTDELVPSFDKDTYDGNVPESSEPNTPVIKIEAVNKDGTHAGIVYNIKTGSNNALDYFRIDVNTGDIYVIDGNIDAEVINEFTLFVEATDTRLEPQRSGITTVVITVGDINDQCPFFGTDVYAGSLQQGETFVLDAAGRLIIRTFDGDQTFNGSVEIISDETNAFELNEAPVLSPNTKDFYLITTDQTLDINTYEIVISVKDDLSQKDPPCQADITTITVTVTPSTELPPSFIKKTYTGSVPEGPDSDGVLIVTVEAENGEGTGVGIFYRLVSASNDGETLFRVDGSTGEVYVDSPNINAELVTEYTLFIEAQDNRATPVLSDTAKVIVTIVDINDNDPIFEKPSYDVTLPEDARTGYIVITVVANDADQSSTIEYTLTTPGVPFAIDDPSVGTIIVSGELDRETPGGNRYELQVRASDGLKIALVIVTIVVSDVNDNSPVFSPKTYDLSLEENDNTPVFITVIATDLDDGDGGTVIFILQSPLDKNIVVNRNSGLVTFNGPYDREVESQIVAIIIARNDGEPVMSDTAEVTLTITDVNDEKPVFEENGCGAEVLVSEGAEPGFIMCKVLAVDGDEDGSAGAEITYSLVGSGSGFFRIDKDINTGRGLLKVDLLLDREVQPEYTITIVASDGGTPSLSTNLDLTIQVTDINDEPPQFDPTQPDPKYRKSFQNEVSSGTEVISVVAEDRDAIAAFRTVLCNLTSVDGSHEYFYVSSDGAVCTIFTQLDLKVQPTPYMITIQAYNPDQPNLVGNNKAELSVYVTLDDCIVIIEPSDYYALEEVADIDAGVEVVRVLANSSPCGENGIVFNITKQTLTPTPYDSPEASTEFTIDPMTGVISAVGNNPSFGTHNMEVIAYNASKIDTNTDTGYVTIVVIPNTNNPPTFDRSEFYADPVLLPKLADFLVIDLENNATDPDFPFTAVGEIVFSEISEKQDDTGSDTNYFKISVTGQVTLENNILELSEAITIEMIVKVEDKGKVPQEDTASVFIVIEPPITAPPVFIDGCSDTLYVDEGATPPIILCQVVAEGSSAITYSIDDPSNFAIRLDGTFVTNKEFDFENPAERQFKVLVTATSNDGLTATTPVNVVINDTNDAAPEFGQDPYEFSILEDVASGGCAKYVGMVQATDADSDDFSYIEYSIVEPYNFTIDRITGEIETKACIDRESSPYQDGQIDIVVRAANPREIPVLDDYATVHITIGDQNDNDPVFQQDRYPVLLGSLPPSTELVTVRADDDDVGVNAELYYLIAQEQKGIIYEYFTVDRNTGVVSTTALAELPPEEGLEETIIIEVWDSGSPPRNDETEVVVSVTPGYLNEPVYREGDRRQQMFFKENIVNQCYNFEPPLFDESLLVVYTVTNDTSGGKINIHSCGTRPTLCNSEPLDREQQSKYFITVESNTCNPSADPGCLPCSEYEDTGEQNQWIGRMTRDVDQNDAVTPNALQSNQIVIEAFVVDVNDEQPVTRGFIEGLPNKYFIGIADNIAYNTTIFQLDAFDSDLNSSLIFDLFPYTEDWDRNTPPPLPLLCPNLPMLQLNPDGGLLSRDAVYSYLDAESTDISREQVACEYVVRVTDENTDVDYLHKKSVAIPAKIKVLYAFEHAIIMIDSPPEVIVPDAVQIASCLSLGLTDYVLRVEYVRAQFKEERNGVSIVNPDYTDLWVYAIHREDGTFAKYWDLKAAWDDASEAIALCDVVILGMRSAYIRHDYLYPYPAIVGWAVVALACFIAIAAFICMFVLFESWDRMIVARTKYMSTIVVGRDNYTLHGTGMVDAGTVTENAYEWDRSMPLLEKQQKLALFESQEVLMDLFADEYMEEEEDALASFIREKSSPTEVTVSLNIQDWGHEKEEIFTVTKETTSSVAVMDFTDGGDPNAIPLVERKAIESKQTVVLSGEAAKAALARSRSLDKPKAIADTSGQDVKGLVSYFSVVGAEPNPPDHVYDEAIFVHPSPPISPLDDESKAILATLEVNIEIQEKDTDPFVVQPSPPASPSDEAKTLTAEVNVEIHEKDSDSSASSSDEDSDSNKKAADTNVAIYEKTLPRASALVGVDLSKSEGAYDLQFQRSMSSSIVKKEQGQTGGGGSFMRYESTTSSSSTTMIGTGDKFPPGLAKMMPPITTGEPKGDFIKPPGDDNDKSGATDETK